MTELDPRADDAVREATDNLLLFYAVNMTDRDLIIATVNLAIGHGVILGIDLCSAALKSGNPDHAK